MRAVSGFILTDDQLLEFLRLEEDRVPRAVAEEILRRGDWMRDPLTSICRDEHAWRQEGPAFWTPVHAAYLLGAVGGTGSLKGLLAALRWASRYDVDWVWESMPSMLGPLGRAAVPPLRAHAFDPDGGERERVVSVHALAGVAARHPVEQGEVLDLLRAGTEDPAETPALRGACALALLAFVRPGDRTSILGEALRQRWSDRAPLFDEQDVEAAYARGTPDLSEYLVDWMAFYDPARIAERQRAWREQEEDLRWARGAAAGASWVDREQARFVRSYEASLVDLDDEARGDALWVAESMAEYLVWHEGRAPWRWNGATAFAYLMDAFARRVAADQPGRIAAVPDAMARFIRFCAREGRLGERERADAEARIATERHEFVDAARDPERRREARETLGRLLADGVDPARPEREGTRVRRSAPASRETGRRSSESAAG